MSATQSAIRGRLEEVRSRMARAALASGRDPAAVTLVGVTKSVTSDRVLEAIGLGLADVGENRVQEAQAKIATVGRARARWHLIGHLQRNKAARAVGLFDRVHTVDDAGLAETLSRHAQAAGRVVPALVEVNISGEATKFGVAPAALNALLERVAGLPGLSLEGLMTVGAAVERAEDARPAFARLRALRDASERVLGRALPQLSMGMSGDYEVAIQEGATLVRVGGALFGPRAA